MEASCQIPYSNADAVAFTLVDNAIIDDIDKPGNAIARLLETMTAIARNLGADTRAADADWQKSLLEVAEATNPDFTSVGNVQELVIGEVWAQRWMLARIAKHLYEELERTCIETPAASGIQSITYAESGTVESWKMRS